MAHVDKCAAEVAQWPEEKKWREVSSPQEPQEARGLAEAKRVVLEGPAFEIAVREAHIDHLRARIAELETQVKDAQEQRHRDLEKIRHTEAQLADARQTIAYAIDRHKALEDELAAVTRQRDDAHDDVLRVAREREQASRAAMLAERECLGLRAKLEAALALILEAVIDVRHQGNLELANRMAAFYHGKPALANPTDSAGEAEGKEKG